jgi:DNA gyrase subunit A
VTEKSGNVAAAKLVNHNQQLMLVSKDGLVISTPVRDEDGEGIPIAGRNTQGFKIMCMGEGDCLAAGVVWD